MTHKVIRWTVLEGPLYEVPGECGMNAFFDCEVVAVTPEGFYGNNLIVKGLGGYNDDGFPCPNYHYKEDCLAIIAKFKHIPDVSIDEADGWYFIPPVPDLETRLEAEAIIENAARHGMGDIGYPYPQYDEASWVNPPALRADDVRALALEERLLMGGGLSDADRAFLSRYNE